MLGISKIIQKKVKAGAIQYVLVASVIIMIVLFSFVSLVTLQHRFELKLDLFKTAVFHANSAFDYINQKNVPYDQPIQINLSENKNEQTELLKKHWGIFDLLIASAQMKNERIVKVGLLGHQQEKRNALYLEETNKPLVVVGRTQIKGDVVLPKLGIKTGNIAGNAYYSDRLVYGRINRNATELPKIHNTPAVERLLKENPSGAEFFELDQGMNRFQSFTNKTLIFETNQPLFLSEIQLAGNILIRSSQKIIVEPTALLEDVILIAPEVEVKSFVQGTFQVLASENIELKENVTLSYPSSLILISENEDISPYNNPSDQKRGIQIREKANVKGSVVYISKSFKEDNKAQVFIDKDALIKGEVYCNKNLELRGLVQGSVYTKNFVTREYGGIYINHLFNGSIDSTVLPDQYAGVFIGSKNKVAKFLE